LAPAAQEFIATRAHAHIYNVRASHVPMMSQPKATIDVVKRAINAVD
jgi:hypothetical protein